MQCNEGVCDGDQLGEFLGYNKNNISHIKKTDI